MKLLIFATLLVVGVISGSRSEGQTAKAVKRESPFACDRLALNPAARKHHFDELAPA